MKIKNRFVLAVVLLIASLATAQIPCNPTTLPNATSSVNWPQFHYDNAHTGCNPYESVLSPSTVGKLVLDWKYTTGYRVESAPTVANGIVYVASDDNYLYALNANTGALIWKFDTGFSGVYSPTVVNGLVYALSYHTGSMVALNAGTGEPVWSRAFTVISSPVVSGGVLYLATGSNVYALNASTGEEIWTSDEIGVVQNSLAIANGVIYVGSADSNLYALSASNGKVLWTCKTGDSIDSSPAVANGIVYVGNQDWYIYAVDAKDGTLLWKASAGPVACGPWRTCGVAVADGVVYVDADFPNFAVLALDGRTGDTLWLQLDVGGSSSPAVANGVVYVGSDDNKFYALKASTGEILWNYPTGDYVSSSPAVANGKVYVGSLDGNIYAFHLPGQ